MSLLIIIPARGGSKRLPGKHLRPLVGMTLLEWTAQSLAEAAIEAPCLLTTDDRAIADAGRRLGWMVPFLRPSDLARDDSPSIDPVLHALDWFTHYRGGAPDMIMLMQTTSPLRGGAVLRRGYDMLREDEDADAVVGVVAGLPRARYVFAAGDNDLLQPLTDSDDDRQLVIPNGALYVIRTATLRAFKGFFPPKSRALVMDRVSSIDIDTEEDWRMAEAMLHARSRSMRVSGGDQGYAGTI